MATRIARRTIDSTVGLEFSNILNAMYTNPKMSRIDAISIVIINTSIDLHFLK